MRRGAVTDDSCGDGRLARRAPSIASKRRKNPSQWLGPIRPRYSSRRGSRAWNSRRARATITYCPLPRLRAEALADRAGGKQLDHQRDRRALVTAEAKAPLEYLVRSAVSSPWHRAPCPRGRVTFAGGNLGSHRVPSRPSPCPRPTENHRARPRKGDRIGTEQRLFPPAGAMFIGHVSRRTPSDEPMAAMASVSATAPRSDGCGSWITATPSFFACFRKDRHAPARSPSGAIAIFLPCTLMMAGVL